MPQVTDPQTVNYRGVWHVSVVRLVKGVSWLLRRWSEFAIGDRKLEACEDALAGLERYQRTPDRMLLENTALRRLVQMRRSYTQAAWLPSQPERRRR